MKLAPEDITARAAQLPGWTHALERGGVLTRTFEFADFVQAFGFMSQVAPEAHRLDHHPEWHNVYGTVSVTLTTHDVGGLSHKDFELASFMDRLAPAPKPSQG